MGPGLFHRRRDPSRRGRQGAMARTNSHVVPEGGGSEGWAWASDST